MKRIVAFLTATVLLLTVTACSSRSSMPTPPVENGMMSRPAESGMPTTVAGYRLGLGVVSRNNESLAVTEELNGRVDARTTICALAVDGENRIVDVKFDTMHNKMGFDRTGNLLEDLSDDLRSMRMRGDPTMNPETADAEWFGQMDALEEWMRGKTVTEVLNMKVFERDPANMHVPDEEDLKMLVTMSVTDELRALERANRNLR